MSSIYEIFGSDAYQMTIIFDGSSWSFQYDSEAEQWGAGSAEIGDIIALNAPQDGTTYPVANGIVKQLTRNVIADSACSACFAALVRGLYMAQESRLQVNQRISIGQDVTN